MTDYDRAMRDPKSCFSEPCEVLTDNTLSNEQKISVLKQWEYDARELSVAEEENMLSETGETPNMLNRIKVALRQLGVEHTDASGGKQ